MDNSIWNVRNMELNDESWIWLNFLIKLDIKLDINILIKLILVFCN